jgi:hypothetical protein
VAYVALTVLPKAAAFGKYEGSTLFCGLSAKGEERFLRRPGIGDKHLLLG